MRHTAEQMASILLNFMQEKKVWLLVTAEASRMTIRHISERYNGVQAIVKRECKYAAFIPCCNHSLNIKTAVIK